MPFQGATPPGTAGMTVPPRGPLNAPGTCGAGWNMSP